MSCISASHQRQRNELIVFIRCIWKNETMNIAYMETENSQDKSVFLTLRITPISDISIYESVLWAGIPEYIAQ